ncbi:beta-ketoacyl synthase N-terminal-like domain-containing protein [Chitinophaga sp. Cy-1792]|uniref:beta-ketoacyl synthase N-terminal-like domain-containing protein n=1 Tax=Chitinophaga sp. Cy-1792 TaxID=2608339 RepID=UPI0014210319|nr:beta-ketoacyl synthase N-terminal-like domain-containing protein [Chitinophaga sp. Cy-1792]NIG57196.1 3-oxoacyl-ACP synthase [Chitinophaga sp. Cy-1792]
MKNKAYITGSCIIRNNSITLNGQLLFSSPGVELQEFLRGAYDQFSGQYPKFHKMDPLSKLGWLAAEALLKDSNVYTLPKEAVGMLLSNRSASLDTDLRYYATVMEFASPALFVYTLPNIVMGEISIRHGFKGENTFFVSSSFDAGLLSDYATALFAETPLQACLVAWVEVMEKDYEVVMALVEKEGNIPLSAENLMALYA